MLENGRRRQHLSALDEPDFLPVVKLFTPDANCVWLLTELDPDDPDLAYGLCDLGMGFPELGYVRMSEIDAVRGRRGLPVERDRRFKPDKTVKKYAEEARIRGRVE
jgi:hypothetical protein